MTRWNSGDLQSMLVLLGFKNRIIGFDGGTSSIYREDDGVMKSVETQEAINQKH